MLADHLGTIEDRDKRTKYAHTLVALMRQLNPTVKEDDDTTQKNWDDLHIMTNFGLDVESPFPMPAEDILTKKPERMSYHKAKPRYKHYGQNVEHLIEIASNIENEDDKKGALIYLGKLMKTFYTTWNRDNVDDEVIVGHIRSMSKGKLDISVEEVKAQNLFDSNIGPSPKSRSNNNSNKSNNNNKGRRNNRRKKNK